MEAVVLLSGGIDSTTCLAMAVEKHGVENVHCLTFAYGQKHQNELDNALDVANYYNVPLTIAKVDHRIFEGSNSTLLQGNGEISHQSYAETIEQNGEGTVDTYVPFRNGLMLSQASALAYSLGASVVYYGAHADDAAGSAYPDCTPEFYEAMNNAIKFGTANKVSLQAPLINMNKATVVDYGLHHEAPYQLTRSCYEGHKKQCGECGTCIDRINAFKANSAIDPVPYEVSINWEEA